MARLRRPNGTYRRTTIEDFGAKACSGCGRLRIREEPKRDENGFFDPITRYAPCPDCDPPSEVGARGGGGRSDGAA